MNIDYHQHGWICSVVNEFDNALLDWLAELPDEDWPQVRAMSFPQLAAIVAAQAQLHASKGINQPR